MGNFLKNILSIFYLSLGILYGVVAANFPFLFKPGTFFQKWGLLMLMSSAILCPIGILSFGWLKKTSKATMIWIFVISIPGIAIWFLFSSFVAAWVGVGGDG